MKRLISLLFCLVLLTGLLAACGKETSSLPVSSIPDVSVPQPQPEPEPPASAYTLPDASAINPLTGGPRAEGMQDGARPVAVMVANNAAALPQRGLAAADVLYEMLTEGGITRLMALYPDAAHLPEVGPVRSTRDDFVQLVLPYNGIMVSIGTSVYARNLLTQQNYAIVNGIYLGTSTFYFDHWRHSEKSNEYCWFTNGGSVAGGIQQMEMDAASGTEALFAFKAGPRTGEEAMLVELVYSASSNSSFRYDAASGLYQKSIFGLPHTDEDGTPLAYTNVFALTGDMGVKLADGVSPEFDLTAGEGWYFTGGVAQKISWTKQAPSGTLQVYDETGAQLEVHPGKSYIGFVPRNSTAASVSFGPLPAVDVDGGEAADVPGVPVDVPADGAAG